MPRNFYWRDTLVDSVLADGGQVIPTLMGDITPTESRGMTIERVILDLQLIPTSLWVAEGTQLIDIGIGVVGQDALTAGAVPDPSVTADRPPRGWLFRTRCLVQDHAAGPAPIVLCKGDFRGKRKVDHGELVMIADSTAQFGTAFSVTITGIVRMGYLMA